MSLKRSAQVSLSTWAKFFGSLRIFIVEAVDYTVGAVVFEALGLGGDDFVQDLCRGQR